LVEAGREFCEEQGLALEWMIREEREDQLKTELHRSQCPPTEDWTHKQELHTRERSMREGNLSNASNACKHVHVCSLSTCIYMYMYAV